MPKEILFTQPLHKFVQSHLGCGMWHCKEIDEERALIIFSLTKNEHTCFIQWADKYNPDLLHPVLWDYQQWCLSSDKWERAAKRSQIEADERWVMEANVRLVAKAWVAFSGVDVRSAETVAYNLIRMGRDKAIKAIGVERLYVDVKEIP